jgi:hypothetical protein
MALKEMCQAYHKNISINEDVTRKIFEELTEKIMQKNSGMIGDLLLMMNKIINDDKTKNKSIVQFSSPFHSPDTSDKKFLHDYSIYLSQNNNDNVLSIILKSIRCVKTKLDLTRLVFECQGFRSIIKTYPKSKNGFTAMSDSIFSSVTNKDSLMSDIESAVKAFEPLLNDESILPDLIRHLEYVFHDNIGYTYSDPNMIDRTIMSSLDFCFMCLSITTNIAKKYSSHEQNYAIRNLLVLASDVVYFPIYSVKSCIADAINARKEIIEDLEEKRNKTKIMSDADKVLLKTTKDDLRKGISMMNNLTNLTNTIDVLFVDEMIFNTIDDILSSKKYDYLSRLINSFGQRPLTTLKHFQMSLAKIVVKIISKKDIPIYTKFDAIRLVMSHNLKKFIFQIENSHSTLTEYILSDVQRMKELDKVHLIDLMVELSDTPIMTDSRIIELYMYLIPDFIDQFTQILGSFNNLRTESKPNAINDVRKFIEASCLMVLNLPILGDVATSYVNNVLEMVDTMANTSNYLKKSNDENDQNYFQNQDQNQNQNQDQNQNQNQDQDYEDSLKIFNEFKKVYVEKIKPFVRASMKVLIKDSDVTIISSNSLRILTDVLSLSVNDRDCKDTLHLKILDKKDQSELSELSDIITCDLALNPYFINAGTELHLIDRKTYFSICRSMSNPFTREYIDKKILDELNQSDKVLKMRSDILEKIKKLN